MIHPFIPSVLDSSKCAICAFDAISHGSNAECEFCDFVGSCEIDYVTKSLCCSSCMDISARVTRDEARNNLSLIDSNGPNPNPETARFIQNTNRLPNFSHEIHTPVDEALSIIDDSDLIANSQLLDKAMNHITFYNAQSIPNIELKNAIDNDDSILPENKLERYSQVMLERFETFQKNIWEHQNIVYENTERALKIRDDLRAFGNGIRREIREKLTLQDSEYQIEKKVVKPVIKKKTAQEKLIENIMIARNCSKEEATKLYEKMELG